MSLLEIHAKPKADTLHRNKVVSSRVRGNHRPSAESLLRDIAFVLQATQKVRAAMTETPARCLPVV